MKREAQFTLQFRHWLKANPMPASAFELKQTTTSSLPFSAVKEHQIAALMSSKSSSGMLYKIPDDSVGIKPFDLVYLRETFAWVVIKYPTAFHIIDVETFVIESKRSKRRSLTSKRAYEIATISVKY